MFIPGISEKLRANPGDGRDCYDDSMPNDLVVRMTESMKAVSPGFRNWVVDLRSRFGFHQDDKFYEGMLCGLGMAAQMLKDLAEGDEKAKLFYSGPSGLISIQAGVVARHVGELREMAKARKKETDHGEEC